VRLLYCFWNRPSKVLVEDASSSFWPASAALGLVQRDLPRPRHADNSQGLATIIQRCTLLQAIRFVFVWYVRDRISFGRTFRVTKPGFVWPLSKMHPKAAPSADPVQRVPHRQILLLSA
jgi:hypothetical protein